MFTIGNVVQPDTLDQAYELLMSKKNNTVLGGCAFLKMSSKRIATGIDLSELQLNTIKEQDGVIEIGAMTTFRDIETSALLKQAFRGILPIAVSPIIGVQFRNVVTLGASVYSKYGFSDILTALLALETEVERYHGGRMPLDTFLSQPVEKDILTRIFIKNEDRDASYQSMRNSASDYPILNVAVSRRNDQWRVAVGARPVKAEIARKASEFLSEKDLSKPETIEGAASLATDELSFGTNLRGTAEYRKALCKVLVKRGITEVLQCKSM